MTPASDPTPLGDILIVEDDPAQLRLYAKALRGYRVVCVANGTAALEQIRRHIPDVILLDQVLANGERGTDFLPRLKDAAAHVPIVIVSGTLDIAGRLQALQGSRAAHYVLEKPVDVPALRNIVHRAITECGLDETVRSLQSLERAEKIGHHDPERRFTERLARQNELLKRLRGTGTKPNITHLAGEFGVSRKTILRDLHDLIQRGQLHESVYPDWQTGGT
ncbi:MAG TPA: response regulator [Methylomirabilota bacterium]|nr:response regulator [Methylomirabilota bacterium]